MVWTHEILAGGSPNSTHKNTPYRLDKLRSALAEAQLKSNYVVEQNIYMQSAHKIPRTSSGEDREVQPTRIDTCKVFNFPKVAKDCPGPPNTKAGYWP